MKRKILSTVLAVSMFATVFTGCGATKDASNGENAAEGEGGEQTQELESGNVDLKLWVEEASIPTTQKMVDSFKQQYGSQASINVTIEPVEGSDTRDVLLGDISNAADVFVFADDQLSSFVSAGAIDIVPNASEVSAANIADAVDASTLNGNLYAYPMTADNGYFLYYNKKYLSESDVQTMDQLLKVASDNEKKITFDMSSGWYLYSFFGNTGLDMGINADGLTNHCDWNAETGDITGVEITQAILDVTTNAGFKAGGDDVLLEGAKNGSVIAGVSGVWSAVALKEAWGSDYAACKLPTYTVDGKQIQMSSFKGYKMAGVNYYSKHKAWAHKLADWITNEENQTIRFAERSQGPSNIKAAASDLINAEPAIQAVIDQGQFGVLQRIGNSYWDACSEFGEVMADGNPSGLPLQDIIDELAKSIAAGAV